MGRPHVTVISAADFLKGLPCVYDTRNFEELRTKNTGFGGMELQDVISLSFIPTKSNHAERFFLRGVFLLKVFPP